MQVWRSDIRGNYAEKILGARIDLLINSPLFAILRGVLRERGTGSHAPDRQKSCSPPERPLCAFFLDIIKD